jgi:hypothetical protein
MKSTASIVFATATLALLSACGGSGGNDNGPPPTVDPNSVTLTASNQSAVARATVAGGFSVAQAGTADAHGRTHAQSVGGARAPVGVGAMDKAVRLALARYFNQRKSVASAKAHPAAVSSSTDDCSGGGTRSASFNDVDNSLTASVGDVVTVSFDQCQDSGSLLDGALVVTLASVPNDTQLSGTAQFQQLSVTDGTVTSQIDGAVTLSETDTGSEADVTLTIGTLGLAVSASSPTYADAIAFDPGMTIVTTDQYNADRTTVTLDGSFSATSIGGRVTIETLAPIVAHSTDDFPVSGQVRVTGADDGRLLLTIVDTTKVELQLDADGNGVYEGDVFIDWTTLLP